MILKFSMCNKEDVTSFLSCLGANVFIKVNPNSFCGTKASAPRNREKTSSKGKGEQMTFLILVPARLKINYILCICLLLAYRS